MSIVYVNGQMMNAEEAVVSVYDHGFLYGLGLFETFRTYQGKCFLLERHMQRLSESCKQLGIEFNMEPEHVQRIVSELLLLNHLAEGYVRLTVSGGVAELGLPAGDYAQPTIVIMVKSVASPTLESWRQGKPLQLLHTKRNTPEGAYRFKSLHYMNNIIAKRELLSLGERTMAGAEGLMLNEQHVLAEGIVSNLFFVHGNCLYTPHLSTGILPGITRQFVIELAGQLGFSIEEGKYDFSFLAQSSEIWMTNSIQELVPITTLIDLEGNRLLVSNGTAGPVCEQLAAAYRTETVKVAN
ncbi:4-amino-4-deoxychorismate lyase [Paenibacillus montaniterrae]|uniref:4-amino-4-deoxychorismate lyase n=1 Tax=Paenibacillus montaniterrae TaxID=429341 RepID=A0A920D262_9BACL|nr:aminodeoxychorismate lyase [Paenibacillus montaniterrae]GIP19629.1 4-amino-4-deoxychorismate lyase [Paenibacillus montaniterrae]